MKKWKYVLFIIMIVVSTADVCGNDNGGAIDATKGKNTMPCKNTHVDGDFVVCDD